MRDLDTASRLRIAETAEASGNLEIALSLYRAAAAADPGRADVQARYASLLSRTGNLPEAEAVLTRALARHPNDAALQVQLGRLRLRTGAPEQALTIFDGILVRAPANAEALDGRGVALDLLDRSAEAQQAYLAARAAAPQDPRFAGNLAFSFLLEGRAREARDVLEPFAGRPNLPPRVRTSLAIARAMTGDRDGAAALLGPDVTPQDLDQLVASLPSSRPSATARASAPEAAPATREPRRVPRTAAEGSASSVAPGADAEPIFRPFVETAPARPRPARPRPEAPPT